MASDTDPAGADAREASLGAGDAPGAPVRPARSKKLRWAPLVGGIVGLACVAFVAKSLAGDWNRVGQELRHAHYGWLVVGVVLGGFANTWLAAVWADALTAVGDRRPRGRVIVWFYVGQIGKYLPGGVWTVLGRGELARREGVRRPRSYASVVLSLTVMVLAGLLTLVVLVPFDLAHQSQSATAYLVLLLLPVGVAALHPRVFGLAVRVVAKVMGRPLEVDVPSWGRALWLVVLNVPFWLGLWASTWAVARAFVADPSLLRIGIAAVLAWAVGVVAVPVPAGAGVREAVFIASSGLAAGLGATIAVASRIVYLVVDVVGALVAVVFLRRGSGRAAIGASEIAGGSDVRAGPATGTRGDVGTPTNL